MTRPTIVYTLTEKGRAEAEALEAAERQRIASPTPRYARARVLAGLSLRQAARLLGIAPPYLSAYEAGRDVPELALQQRMAATYEAGLPWLLGEAPELAPDDALPPTKKLTAEERRELLELLAMHGQPDRGVAGDRCEVGNNCGRAGCPECQR